MERILDIGIQCDRWRRVKEATGIEKDEKMMEILIDATTSELESFNIINVCSKAKCVQLCCL
ncbi:hypothetical protein DPMN_037144 [Dreissena polymorpha]|uniref:Uncharacterized protein n=1 Tax=Dreissena polymorpha TaxID=45954 RepID=A0A9D4MC41_DREPO|nr:hypothetical protein DPMN_037144 [Dreissena polymorpha]